MGATLGHLHIYDFNLTLAQKFKSHDSIDFASANPVIKANTCSMPYDELLAKTGWKSTDIIVRVVMIGAINGSMYGTTGPFPMKEPISFVFCKAKLCVDFETRELTEEEKKMTQQEIKEYTGIKDENVKTQFQLEYGSSISEYKLDIFDISYKDKIYDGSKFENI